MIKLTFCLVRLPHLSREAFQNYWYGTHAPLVASVAEILQIRRYVQMHSLPAEASAGIRASRDAPPEFDGVAELWWDSLDELMGAATKDPKWQEASLALLEDEKKFIDLANSPLLVATERPVVNGDIR